MTATTILSRAARTAQRGRCAMGSTLLALAAISLGSCTQLDERKAPAPFADLDATEQLPDAQPGAPGDTPWVPQSSRPSTATTEQPSPGVYRRLVADPPQERPKKKDTSDGDATDRPRTGGFFNLSLPNLSGMNLRAVSDGFEALGKAAEVGTRTQQLGESLAEIGRAADVARKATKPTEDKTGK